MELTVHEIVALQELLLPRWEEAEAQSRAAGAELVAMVLPEPPAEGATMTELVEAAHFSNFVIWHLEDEARLRDAPDARIAAVKRAIDAWNQRRNDLMERIDLAMLARFASIDVEGVRLHSETAGMMLDRLSILALKLRHAARTAEEAAAEADAAIQLDCEQRLRVLAEQRGDLEACLEELLAEFAAGRRCFKSYRQLKTYNDERLNPLLRAAARAAIAAAGEGPAKGDA